MTASVQQTAYVPGTYAHKRPEAARTAQQYIQEWDRRRIKAGASPSVAGQIPPAICFSRKIGVGALEVADILAKKIKFRVADRVIIETIASDNNLAAKTVAFFDERYPGKMIELTAMLFGEKSFIMSDYIRKIVSAVFAMAETGATIFVGRGVHLLLPRDRVLAVRFISSDEHRINRLSRNLGIEADAAAAVLKKSDKEQREFFKKGFGRKEASPYEFDLVINFDFLKSPAAAATIVAKAFKEKFKNPTG